MNALVDSAGDGTPYGAVDGTAASFLTNPVPEPDATFFAELALRLSEETDPAATLRRVAEFAQNVAGCGEAGLVLTRGHSMASAARTSAAVGTADLLQADMGEGPALLAMRSGQRQQSGNLAADARWPSWGPRAQNLGFRSVVSVRLHAKGSTLGALDFYSEENDGFTPVQLQRVTVFALHAAIALATAAYADSLRRAIDSHGLVGQAQGILMEKYHMTPEAAFRVLKRYSQNRNIKLRSLAESVIATRTLPEA